MADPTPEQPQTAPLSPAQASQAAQELPETDAADEAEEAPPAAPAGSQAPAVAEEEAEAEPEPENEQAPAPVEAEDPDLVAARSALEAPGHAVGDTVVLKRQRHAEGFLFPCGVDALGRVWRITEVEEGFTLTFAGRLQT